MKRLIGILLISLVILGGCINTGEYLNLAIQPEESPVEAQETWQPLADYLQEYIGIKVVLRITTDYSSTIVALKTGHADIAKLGPFSYTLATREAKINPLVRGVRADTGLAFQVPYIFVRTDSGITSIQDLKGRSFAFVDEDSTSGYLVPMASFEKLGIVPETYFSQIYFAGSHDLSIQAVKMGKTDAGCSNNLVYEMAIKEGIIKEGEFTIIYQAEPIPTDVIVVRHALPEELKQKLLEAFLNMPSELSIKVSGDSGYIKAYESDFDGIREIAKILDKK